MVKEKQVRIKKKGRKAKWVVLAVILICIFSAIGNDSRDTTEPKPEPQQEVQQEPQEKETTSTSEPEKIENGWHTLPSGLELLFSDYVRNDVTGRWRLSSTSSSMVPADYAMEYYNTMFSSDDEIHGIWNATLNTTTCIKVMSGNLFVDTYEYVDGEEHDANLLFSGTLLDSKLINLSTGEVIE